MKSKENTPTRGQSPRRESTRETSKSDAKNLERRRPWEAHPEEEEPSEPFEQRQKHIEQAVNLNPKH